MIRVMNALMVFLSTTGILSGLLAGDFAGTGWSVTSLVLSLRLLALEWDE